MYWVGRHDGFLPPCRLVGSILVDQISTEDEQSLEQGIGHVGPAKLDHVVLDGIHTMTGGPYGDLGFSTDVFYDLLSTLIKSYGLLGVMWIILARWESTAHQQVEPILWAIPAVQAGPMVTVLVGRLQAKTWAPHP